jgi:high-affinity iron transporter
MHTAWEAGWITFGQSQALDLTWLIQPGTVSSALLTGMLGFQPKPTQVELTAYLLYALPMLTYVLWPRQVRTQKSPAGRSTPSVQPTATAS